MALFDETLANAIITLLKQQHTTLGIALGANTTDYTNTESNIYKDIILLIEVANGQHWRDEVLVAIVEAALHRVLALLLNNAINSNPTFPDGFWNTDIGIMVSRVRWWVSAEDLITISNAAALAFGANTQANRMRIARAMDNGTLDWVPDPSVVNPQQNRRVLRSQVERLRQAR